MDAPCFKCKGRHVGCHGECDDYREWVSAKEIEKSRHPADDFIIENSIRCKWFANQKNQLRLGAQL